MTHPRLDQSRPSFLEPLPQFLDAQPSNGMLLFEFEVLGNQGSCDGDVPSRRLTRGPNQSRLALLLPNLIEILNILLTELIARAHADWDGPSEPTLRSTLAGPQAMRVRRADTRQNWLRLHRTSSSRVAARQWGHCCGQPAPCRLCSRTRPIRSAPDTLKAWRGRAAISRALRHLNTALAQNG